MQMRQLLPFVLATLALGACDTKEAGGTNGNAQMLDDTSMTGKSCELVGETMTCGEGGVAFCDDFAGDLEWGPCIDEMTVECSPEESPNGCSTCVLYGGIPYWDDSDCGGDTPLVLRFDERPIAFTPMSSATFDIGGIGVCESHDWPAAETPWLALDVDQNGSIDSGRELFGSGTLMANGRRATNGFEALAELDSNGDTRIDAQDERFAELLTWADHDQDKVGHGLELQSSVDAGLVSIELAYDRNPMCDARGNCGVERAAFTWREASGDLRQGEVVDVHLPCR